MAHRSGFWSESKPSRRRSVAGTDRAVQEALGRKSPVAIVVFPGRADPAVAQRHGSPSQNQAACETSSRCEWCGEVISRWRFVAMLREPPLCSRKCVKAWANREL
jgi:hypothetical protein